MKYRVSTSKAPSSRKAEQFPIGSLLRVTDIGDFNGKTLLRHYDGFVCLEDPKSTWPSICGLLCQPLAPGETVTLTAI